MSALNDVLAWWIGQLRGLVPSHAGRDQGLALIAQVAGGTGSLTQRRRSRETDLGALDSPRVRAALGVRRRPPVLLRVPAHAALERTVQLPLATAPELPRVLAYEFDRLTPFTTEEAAWTYRVERRDTEAARLHIRIALVPLATLAPAVATLRTHGITPEAVLVAPSGPGGEAWRIPLVRSAHARTRPAALAAAWAGCATLALVALALPVLRQQIALDDTEARIARFQPQLAEADALRRRIASRASGLDAIAVESARVGEALNAIGTLTALLPDDTWLTTLSLKQRNLTMSGRTASAARLIPLLAADPAIRNAALTAPVTRAESGPGGSADVFSIRAEIGS